MITTGLNCADMDVKIAKIFTNKGRVKSLLVSVQVCCLLLLFIKYSNHDQHSSVVRTARTDQASITPESW